MFPARPKVMFSSPFGTVLTRDELIQQIEEKRDAIHRACCDGAKLLALAFQLSLTDCAQFVESVYAAITYGTDQALQALREMDIDPKVPAEYRVTPENLIEAQDRVNDAELRFDQVKKLAETMPEGVQAVWKLSVYPMLEDQIKNAQQWRDTVQKQLEQQADEK